MTQTSPAPAGQPAPAISDAELITRARGGETEAFGLLYERHRAAAVRLARQLVPAADADDLVSEAFTRVLDVLRSGGGPDVSFRAYLLTTLRRRYYDNARAGRRELITDDLTPYDGGVPFTDAPLEEFETSAAARAYASLPERWQAVLWHTEVEREKPADVAPLLGLSANGVAALAYRAREGLRQAYLQMHLGETTSRECRWACDRLGAHTRGGLSRREAAAVKEHLDDCPECRGVYLELVAVNTRLPGLLGPVVLGPLAAAYLGKGALAGGVVGGGGGLAVVKAAFGRVRDGVTSSPQAAAALVGAGVGTVAAGALAFVTLTGGAEPPARPAVQAAAPQAPGNPAVPGDPAAPGKPAAPAKPARPGKPAVPASVARPGKPAVPATVAVPATARVVPAANPARKPVRRTRAVAGPAGPAAPAGPVRARAAAPVAAPAPKPVAKPARAPQPAPAPAPAPTPAPAPAPARSGGLEVRVRADTTVVDVDARAGIRRGQVSADAAVRLLPGG